MRAFMRVIVLAAAALLAAAFAWAEPVKVCIGSACRVLETGPLARDFQQDVAVAPIRRNALVRFGSNVKRTFYDDCRKRPLAWCVPLAIQWAVVFTDVGSTCALGDGFIEQGPAHYILGRHPGCAKLSALAALTVFVESNSVNWLANSFQESCDRDAADPNSRWQRVASRTKSAAACFGAVSWGVTGGQAAYAVPQVLGNVRRAGQP